MAWKDEGGAIMDENAADARKELLKMVSDAAAEESHLTASEIQDWLGKWYKSAGYKRLSKILLTVDFG